MGETVGQNWGGADHRVVAAWKAAAGDGDSIERSAQLRPYVQGLLDFHLGPVEQMSNRELRLRWRAHFGYGSGRLAS